MTVSTRTYFRALVRSLFVAGTCFATLSVPASTWACGWTWETYHAEARSLPCVADTVVGYFPTHTVAYHEAVIRATSAGLAWLPQWTEGLDANPKHTSAARSTIVNWCSS